MERPGYLSKYLLDWELFDVVIGEKSGIDSNSFLGHITSKESAENFLNDYGFDQELPVLKAELFGNYQEAIQFIRKYFLKENNPDGLDFKIPMRLCTVANVSDVFLLATGQFDEKNSIEEKIWASIILKVLHTIVHIDKDLRHQYFPIIQQQIFDRFYKFLFRDSQNKLYIGEEDNKVKIPLVDFQTKAKKARDSIIIKLLHKKEYVAEELFDRIGIRIITENIVDILRLIQFLHKKNVIIPHNIKTGRSLNSLISLSDFKLKHRELLKLSLRNNLSEERFEMAIKRASSDCVMDDVKAFSFAKRNPHSSKKYRAIQFTCRQLIKYKNPNVEKFYEIRNMAKKMKEEGIESPLVEPLINIDHGAFSKSIRFFYPFEVQLVDQENHSINTQGEASHEEYKNAQLRTAMKRLFRPLLEYYSK